MSDCVDLVKLTYHLDWSFFQQLQDDVNTFKTELTRLHHEGEKNASQLKHVTEACVRTNKTLLEWAPLVKARNSDVGRLTHQRDDALQRVASLWTDLQVQKGLEEERYWTQHELFELASKERDTWKNQSRFCQETLLPAFSNRGDQEKEAFNQATQSLKEHQDAIFDATEDIVIGAKEELLNLLEGHYQALRKVLDNKTEEVITVTQEGRGTETMLLLGLVGLASFLAGLALGIAVSK